MSILSKLIKPDLRGLGYPNLSWSVRTKENSMEHSDMNFKLWNIMKSLGKQCQDWVGPEDALDGLLTEKRHSHTSWHHRSVVCGVRKEDSRVAFLKHSVTWLFQNRLPNVAASSFLSPFQDIMLCFCVVPETSFGGPFFTTCPCLLLLCEHPEQPTTLSSFLSSGSTSSIFLTAGSDLHAFQTGLPISN